MSGRETQKYGWSWDAVVTHVGTLSNSGQESRRRRPAVREKRHQDLRVNLGNKGHLPLMPCKPHTVCKPGRQRG